MQPGTVFGCIQCAYIEVALAVVFILLPSLTEPNVHSMSAPISKIFAANTSPDPMVRIVLNAEEREWVDRRSEALGMSRSQCIRYVLTQWMRAEKTYEHRPSTKTPEETASGGSSLGASPSASERSGGTTLTHLLRSSINRMDSLHPPAHAAASDRVASADEEGHSESPAAPEAGEETHTPDASAAPSSSSASHAKSVQSLFEIAERAKVQK